MRGRPKSFVIELAPEERLALERLRRKTTIEVGLHKRVSAILLLAENHPEFEVADRAGLGERIVRKWARRYQEERLAGLKDRPGRGRKPVFSP